VNLGYVVNVIESPAERASVLAAAWTVRMGLNSGEVVVGRIGDDLRMDYTAQGQTVGLAARMEQLAAPVEVYLSEHTAELVSSFPRVLSWRVHARQACRSRAARRWTSAHVFIG
jgi:class 3 adenylate cyclase